jgi:uncharacterized protein YsxB (DUF464 family)
MITVTKKKDGITIEGHAGYAEPGKDIVCAGVSTLAQTLIESLNRLTSDDFDHRIDEERGLLELKMWSLSDCGRCMIDSFFIGIEFFATYYPEYVEIIEE